MVASIHSAPQDPPPLPPGKVALNNIEPVLPQDKDWLQFKAIAAQPIKVKRERV